jgi:LysR family transcriptional regulator (chromosome initiation inhibitor)
MSTFDPAALECLAAIVEEGGFERAAQRLNITQSAVSQRLRALEAQVGTVLIVRSRPLKPTSAGHLLLKHTKQLRLLRADLERDLRNWRPARWAARARKSASPSPSTPTASPPGPAGADGPGAAGPAAGDHHRRPGLHPRVAARRPGAGLRHHAQAGLRGCKVVPLGAMEYVAVASRALRASGFPPRGLTAHNFRDVPFIAFNRKDDMQSEFVGKAFGLKRVTLNQLFVPSSEGQVRAVLAGWGVSVVPACWRAA